MAFLTAGMREFLSIVNGATHKAQLVDLAPRGPGLNLMRDICCTAPHPYLLYSPCATVAEIVDQSKLLNHKWTPEPVLRVLLMN